ncbi:MAG: hypothetical protein R3E01_02675 [Pirellulaceae bacterium]|nr:hypothetical protein [Planctomycetales bacterium]
MPRLALPAEPRPDAVTAIVDTREQLPFVLDPLRVERGTLATGDYSVKGLERVIAVERKSLQDLVGCVGRERDRFDREVQRLVAYPVRALVVEASWDDVRQGEWQGRVTPRQVEGSLLGWIAAGLPVIMAGSRVFAQTYTARLLYIAARRRWREARALIGETLADE